MVNKTIHGLKPAISFLSIQLAKDNGKVVTLGGRRSQSRFLPYDYWFRFEDNPRPVAFFAPGWVWKDVNIGPGTTDWSQYRFTINPKLLYREGMLVTRVRLELDGAASVVGLTIEDESPYSKAAFFDSGYFDSNSRVWLEYRRRFTLEVADRQYRQFAKRIEEKLAIPPYIDDD